MSHPVRAFHYGFRLKTIVEARKMSVSDFALQMDVSRTTVYDWFAKKFIEDELLDRIYDKLHSNDNEFFEPIGKYKKPLFIEERIEAIEKQLRELSK